MAEPAPQSLTHFPLHLITLKHIHIESLIAKQTRPLTALYRQTRLLAPNTHSGPLPRCSSVELADVHTRAGLGAGLESEL